MRYAALLLLASPVHATTMTFSDVTVSPTSVSFTASGDFSGYDAPSAFADTFSLQFGGDLWIGGGYITNPNLWSDSPFDNKALEMAGSLISVEVLNVYSWSILDSTLHDAFAQDRRVTVEWTHTPDVLDPLADGHIAFTWGSGGNPANHTVLSTVTAWTPISVPEPATLALLGAGLLGMCLVRLPRCHP